MRCIVFSVSLLLLGCASVAHAQPGGFGLPRTGTTLPEVTIHDEFGDEFSTNTLRGRYSVLVFGCLT